MKSIIVKYLNVRDPFKVGHRYITGLLNHIRNISKYKFFICSYIPYMV